MIQPSTPTTLLNVNDTTIRSEYFKFKVNEADDGGVNAQYEFNASATSTYVQGAFYVIEDIEGTSVAFWVDIDDNGTQSSDAAFTGTDRQVRLDLTTGNSASVNAGIISGVMDGDAIKVSASNPVGNDVQLDWDQQGEATPPLLYTVAGSVVDVMTENQAGRDTNFGGKYLTFGTTYAYFNVDSLSIDPAPVGFTGVPISISSNDSIDTIVQTLSTALDTVVEFKVETKGSEIL